MKFNVLKLDKLILENLTKLDYLEMTPIQEKSLPLTLNREDLIAQAKTGSGKTVAFSLVIMAKLNVKKFRIQSLVLAPTRELANQIADELKKLARFTHNVKITTLCGGMSYPAQVHSLSHQAHIIVGTPGRILKHLEEDTFKCEDIETLVLDEADRMLDMGFMEDITKIINFLPKKRQTLLFSATYPTNIDQLASSILINPKVVKIDTTHEKSVINEKFYKVEINDKTNVIQKCFSLLKPKSVIIFCNTKIECDELADDLRSQSVDVLVIHSDLEQRDRVETLILFDSGSYPVLIATDVAARGLDMKNIDLVLNYSLPHDDEVYTHRIGRTARAGKSGDAITLVGDNETRKFDEFNEDRDNELISFYDLTINDDFKLKSEFRTLYINGGKKVKLRKGDILGALTAGLGVDKNDVGQIDSLDFCSYVAIKSEIAKDIHSKLENTRIKGKYYKVYLK